MDMDIDLLVTVVNSLPLIRNSFDVDYKDRYKKVSSVSSHELCNYMQLLLPQILSYVHIHRL